MEENNKRKLTLDEQIDILKEKNIKFELYPEKEARKFLTYNNYFFKLKSYAHNFDRYSRTDMQDQYINLDFAYIVELSTLDMYLRKWIVSACLDMEHILKTRLMNAITNNQEEDGYHIVQKYVQAYGYNVLNNLYNNIDKSATSELIKKFQEDDDKIPVWSFIETLSFGHFIELYNLYYGNYDKKAKSYSSYLGSIKFLRNAAAHNNCLLNSLKKPYDLKIKKNKDIMNCLSKTKKFKTSYKNKMENRVIHDFIILLFVYWDILNTPFNRRMREKGFEELKELFFIKMKRKKGYFLKNEILVGDYEFVCDVIKYLESSRNKNVLKK